MLLVEQIYYAWCLQQEEATKLADKYANLGTSKKKVGQH